MTNLNLGVNISPKASRQHLDSLIMQGIKSVELFSSEGFVLNLEPTTAESIRERKLECIVHLPYGIDLDKPIRTYDAQIAEYVCAANMTDSRIFVIHAGLKAISRNDLGLSPIVAENLQLLVRNLGYEGIILCLENDEPYTDTKLSERRLYATEGIDLTKYGMDFVSKYDENSRETNMNAFIEVVKSIEGLRVAFDTGHARMLTEDVTDFYEKVKNRVSVIHIHDNNGNLDEHLAVGDRTIGGVDFKKFLNKCKQNNFYGPMIIENRDSQAISRSISYIRSMLI